MNATERSVDRFLKDARSVVHTTGEIFRAIPKDAGAKARDLQRHVVAELDTARKTGVRLQKLARDKAAVVDDQVHRRPYTYIGVALGIGLLAGFLVFRR